MEIAQSDTGGCLTEYRLVGEPAAPIPITPGSARGHCYSGIEALQKSRLSAQRPNLATNRTTKADTSATTIMSKARAAVSRSVTFISVRSNRGSGQQCHAPLTTDHAASARGRPIKL